MTAGKIKPLLLYGILFLSTLGIGVGQTPDFSRVPGVIVAHSPASSGLYIGSPSLCMLPNGDYLASHDLFGPNPTSL
ncbi:hypothetical protein GCM10028803_58060 [Larkinella knui]|uniref:hypothetical protein n=1 Tax=Larkinella knui TaxID=2025310 RepID=UPI001E45446E|nr:hypothetical protein [Larkinella knui]